MRLTPPTPKTFFISIGLAVLAFAKHWGAPIPLSEMLIILAAFIALFLGNLIHGW